MAAAPVSAPPAPTRPRQAAATGSYHELSAQVREAGLLERAPGFYITLLAGLTTVLAGLVTAFVLLGHSWWQLLVAAALGLVLTQFAFVAHEASHRQVLLTGPANDRLGRVLANGVVGISHSWWMTKHTRHHANPNRVGKDPDIEWDTVSFLEEDAAKQRGIMAAITRKQGWLFFPLLTLEGVNLHVLAYKSLIAAPASRARTLELVILTARLSIYAALVLWALPLGMAAAFLAVQLAVFGVYMGASFAPNHKGMAIIPADSRLDFLSKQVLTSRNIGGGMTVTMLMGGLDAQIEHHLFPNMPRPHLARARKIVRAHCESVGMPYTETSLVRSYALVVQYLNRVGLSARDPFDCPMVQRYRARSTR
ncbi:fatty acid desaturase family protein [Cellulomonas dongxiuzhuiae]|uniref:Acyl-CoA desaturase n=1 Tax=Cellulomonas dongxiuzhuiae TaxID=2819979 RepID=A0ABX8GH45_9CELL|nr:acyl-CoA desaturase [Cellulomonas dongxiuzhuiae]MBO3086907.1 acyl-CoA desaturase [Cellulomonas dongxiuzhuiae]MBO3093734.1 acyl-CoA desaturase [Cellulomonas dongxiuzhuiae]QWC14841.1 acyl-CoA desaturase [Cellulomonas dongxiuzhuiae]